LVDDIPSTGKDLKEALDLYNLNIAYAIDSTAAVERLRSLPIETILLDIKLVGSSMSGMQLFHWFKAHYPEIPVIIFSENATRYEAFELGKYRPWAFHGQHQSARELKSDIWAAVEHYRRFLRTEREIQMRGGFYGEGPLANECWKAIKASRRNHDPVMIYGSLGTEKWKIAEGIHRLTRPRMSGEFVPYFAGSLNELTTVRELFGTAEPKTNPMSDPNCKLARAHEGTLFIDHVHKLPLTVQSILWELLESHYDVRLIVATEFEPEKLRALTKLKHPQFRADLLERLERHSIQVPSLSQRIRDSRSDFRLLCAAILREEAERHEQQPPVLTDDAMEKMCQHSWPDNLRELRNVFKELLALGKPLINKSDVDDVLGPP
jgi:DNA-binding NtrC family response regulator